MERVGQVRDPSLLPVLPVDRDLRDLADAAVQCVVQRSHRRAGIRDQRVVRLVGLVDLGRGDVDVDQRLVGEQVVAVVERGVLVEGVADREYDVGLPERLPGARVTAVGEHADAQRMSLGDDALAVQRGQQRDLEALDEPLDLCLGVAADGAEADEYDDLLAALRWRRRALPRLARPGPDRASTGATSRRTSW